KTTALGCSFEVSVLFEDSSEESHTLLPVLAVGFGAALLTNCARDALPRRLAAQVDWVHENIAEHHGNLEQCPCESNAFDGAIVAITTNGESRSADFSEPPTQIQNYMNQLCWISWSVSCQEAAHVAIVETKMPTGSGRYLNGEVAPC
ncbi:MAG: hypothetical protein ACKPKO_50345, partial [Candidatus Fonsibacter sp.]